MVGVFQLVGGYIVLQAGYYEDRFWDFWHGGAFGTPVGFIIGLIWHLSGSKRRRHDREIILLLGVASLALAAAALLNTFLQ